MSSDIRHVLKRAAARPATAVRVPVVIRRGRSLRRRRYGAIAVTFALLVGMSWALWQGGFVGLFEERIPPAESDGQEKAAARLETLTLTADMTKSVTWPSDAIEIPFGSAREELGFESGNESATIVPDSFAIAPDGTIWVTDFLKHRLAQYSPDGTFVKDIPVRDSSVGSKRAFLEDIVFVGDRLFVLMEDSTGRVAEISPRDGEVRRFRIRHEGRPLAITKLESAGGRLYADAFSYVDVLNSSAEVDEMGPVLVDPATGDAQLSPLPLGNGTRVSFETYSFDQGRFSLRFDGEQQWLQPVRFRAVTGKGDADRRALTGSELVPGPDEVALFMMLQAPIAGAGGSYDGGQWLLRIRDPNADGRPSFEWKALPEQVTLGCCRHLSWGPDGSLYVMLARRRGLTILPYP